MLLIEASDCFKAYSEVITVVGGVYLINKDYVVTVWILHFV